jgi:lysyl-tRNA synthetase class 2
MAGEPGDESDAQHEGLPLADHPLTAARLRKLDAARAAAARDDPFPHRFVRTATAAELHEEHGALEPGTETDVRTSVAGRLLTTRHMGKLAFAVLSDWSGRIQLVVDRKLLGERFDEFLGLDSGDWVGVEGIVMTTRRGELSVRVEDFVLLAKGLRPLPEKWHGLRDVEKRHRRRYVDLIVNEDARRMLRIRSATVGALREAMERRGFLEVETPVLQPIAGGGLARPFETHHNALGLDMYLRIATELHLKRLVVGGVEKVFEIGRTFRNEGVSPRHNPEFTMLESYWAFADYRDVMELTEEVVAEVAAAVVGTTELSVDGEPLSLRPPWRRVGMIDATAEATGVEWDLGMSLESARSAALELGVAPDPSWGVGKIVTQVFEAHVEERLWGPVFTVDYPKEVSPLARQLPSDPRFVERFEAFAAGRELANAYSELNDPLEQRARFEAQARAKARGDEEAHPIDEDYLLALEYGMPPTGGLGIGVDRLVMLLAGVDTIREVILFPALRPEAGD